MKDLGTRLLELLNSGVDLLSQELPLFIGELIAWKTAEYSMGFVFSILAIFGGWKLIRMAYKESLKDYGGHDGITIGGGVVGGITGILGVLLSFAFIFDLVQILVAPRIWLLEYANHLMGHH